MHKIFESFASFVVRRRVWVLVGLVLVTGFMLSQARNLRMVIDPNALLPKTHQLNSLSPRQLTKRQILCAA